MYNLSLRHVYGHTDLSPSVCDTPPLADTFHYFFNIRLLMIHTGHRWFLTLYYTN